MCSFCAALLYGTGKNTSNRKFGPPMDRHGQRLLDADGRPLTHEQPPCLLRYSPSLFANEARSM